MRHVFDEQTAHARDGAAQHSHAATTEQLWLFGPVKVHSKFIRRTVRPRIFTSQTEERNR